MPDVFISHSSKDAELAERLCAILEENGIECWMAPRNIMPGDDWASAITKAIKSSKAFLIIYSENSVNSTQVPKEIMLAGGNGSYIIPYRIDDTPLKESYEYHLGASHWIQADVGNGVFKGEELVEAVNRGIGQAAVNVHISVENTAPIHIVTQKKSNKLVPLLLGIGIFLLVALVVTIICVTVFSENKNEGSESNKSTVAIENTDKKSDGDGETGDFEYVSAPVDVDAYDSNNVTVYKDGHGEFLVQGKSYNYGYVMYRMNSFMTINVSDYSQVTFSIARTDDSDDAENKLYVSLDGEEYDYFEVYPDKITSDITIDLSDVEVMRFYVEGNGVMCDVAVFDIKFARAVSGGDVEETSTASEGVLTAPIDFNAFDSENVTIYKDEHNVFSVLGKTYNYGYVFDKMGGRLMFNTEGITNLSFSLGRLDGSYDEENKVYVYVDGLEYDYYNVYEDRVNAGINVSLDGEKHILKIYTTGNGVSSTVCMFDVEFTRESEPVVSEIPEGVTASPKEEKPFMTENATVYKEKTSVYTVNGVGVSEGYLVDQYNSGMLFNVYGYNKVTMTIGRKDGSNYEERKIYFKVDGKEVECTTITPDLPSKEIEIDLNGDAKTLYIYAEGNAFMPEIGIYNMYFEGEKLLQNSADSLPLNAVMIPEDVKPSVCENLKLYQDISYEVVGETIVDGYEVSKYDASKLELENNGYDIFCFEAGCIDGDVNLRLRDFAVYLDGEEFNTYTASTAAGIMKIEIDVKNVKTIEIVTEKGNADNGDIGYFNMYFC